MHKPLATLLIVLSMALAGVWVPPASPTQAAEASPVATPDDEIIYIDAAGFIRVIDPNVASGTQEIRWQSPEGGWFDFAVADVNNDGDKEIVAIGNGKLTVFDPVVQDPNIQPDGLINDVPWARLHEQARPTATLIGGGNLDAGAPGEEIILGYTVNEPNNIRYRLEVLKTPDGGRTWTTHLNQGFGAPWKFLAVGNVNDVGSEDVVLLRDADRLMDVREVDNNFARIFARDDAEVFLHSSAAIGQLYPGGPGEVVLLRTFQGTVQAPVVLIYSFTNGAWQVQSTDQFNHFPHPTFAFFADINGNGDDELFWLRAVAGTTPFDRIFMVNRGPDTTLPPFRDVLDSDGGYRVGAGGDVDGDGRDEVILMRNDRIRNYYAAESGNMSLFFDYTGITTNSRSLKVANLDGNGYVAGTRFAATADPIEAALTAGTASPAPIAFEFRALGAQTNVPFTAAKEDPAASWYSFTLGSNTTPAQVFVTFDATQLPPGVYTDRIRFDTAVDVVNKPFYVTVKLTVSAASFALNPAQSTGFAFRAGETVTQTLGISVQGLPGLKFTAAAVDKPAFRAAVKALGGVPQFGYLVDGRLVLSNGVGGEYTISLEPTGRVSAAAVTWPSGVPWLTVRSAGNTVPDTIVLTGDPTQMQALSEEALLIVVGDERTGTTPENIRIVEIRALKEVAHQLFMPVVRR